MSFNPSTALSVLNGIGSLAFGEAKYLYQVPKEVDGLLAELKTMVSLLQELDGQQQGKLDSHLGIFSTEIRDLAFRCEDVVDTYFLKLHKKIENKNFILKFTCMVGNCYPIHQIRDQIESIKTTVEATNRRLKQSQQVRNPHIASSSDNVERLRDTPGKVLVAKEGFVVGLNEDIKILADKLCADGCSQLSFLAIVGTGGAGKTTLMRKIYDFPAVKNLFPTRALVCVSQEWSGKWLLIEILRQLKVDVPQQSTKPALVEKLQEVLTDKRYLIVLDDIWNRDAWDDISDAFPNFNSGSKILLTTRNSDLLSSINPLNSRNFTHTLKPLDQEEKYHLIYKIALEGREVANIKEFESLAEEMSRKCSGTPLAVVSLAGVLSTKDQLCQWERVKNAMAAYILKGKGTNNYGSVAEMLFLSYRDLPPSLRSCMIYLGIYPEDYVIHTEELIRLWISENLVTIGDRQDLEETIEDVGARFLDELVKRCLLIPVKRNSEGVLKRFQVHDMIRDFCIQKAKEESFFDIMSTSNHWTPAQTNKVQARRIIIQTREGGRKNMIALLLQTINVRYSDLATMRSLIQLQQSEGIKIFLEDAMTLRSIHKSFKLLKVLRLYGITGLDLPNEIGDLINLNYLSVSVCQLEGPYIPDSIKNLRNLLTFDFWSTSSGSYRTEVKDARKRSNFFFEKMEKLRYVYLSDISILGPRVNALKLGKSKSLQILKCDDVRGIEMVDDLAALESLRKLHLENISSQQLIEAVYKCPSLNCLQYLSLRSAYGLFHQISLRTSGRTLDLQNLKHCSVLRKLYVRGISIIEEAEMSQNGGTSPIQFPRNLVSLTLHGTYLRKKESITAISKLPRLKHLLLGYTGQQLVMKPNSYLQLETLELFLDAEEWRFKHEEGDEKNKVILPCLRKLIVNDVTHRLQSLPEELQYMSTLHELEVRASDKLVKRLKDGGEDYHIVKHIPLVSLVRGSVHERH